MISQATLLFAAAMVGILHMSAPDHWATLVALGRISKWSKSRLLEVGVMTAAGHVGLSVLLGFAILGLGIIVSQQLSFYITEAIGALMLIGGLIYGIRELRVKEDKNYEGETREKLAEGRDKFGRRFRYFAILGAALSPDLAILPIFLLALPIGFDFAFATAVVFGISSILALLLFLLLAMAGLARVFERIPPKYNNALVGFVIAAVGVYVLLVG